MRRACIDIGSNTTRLLVAECGEGRVDELHQERVFTHLSRDRLADGTIPEAKLAEVAAVVAEQLRTAQKLGCRDVRAVATAAIRRAGNAAQLAAAVGESCGLEVRVLTGDEEARLAFIGAARGVSDGSAGELGVVDVGGGSSELVVGTAPDRVRWSASVALGSGDLTRTHLLSDPPAPDELARARDEVSSALAELEVPQPARAAAVGGSAASLARLAGGILDRAAFLRALDELMAAPRREVAQRFGLDVDRVRLLPAGLVILQAAAERFRSPLVVAGGGLREGVLMEGLGG